MTDSKRTTAQDRAEASFKQRAIQAKEGPKAAAEYAAAGEAAREKTTRSRAQRLAKEAADTIAQGIANASPELKVKKTGKSEGS